jgi:hypothetical protein
MGGGGGREGGLIGGTIVVALSSSSSSASDGGTSIAIVRRNCVPRRGNRGHNFTSTTNASCQHALPLAHRRIQTTTTRGGARSGRSETAQAAIVPQ